MSRFKFKCFVKRWDLDVRESVHHSKFLTEKPNKIQQRINILLFLILNKAQHVSGDTSSIIRSLKLHKQLLVLYIWKVVGRAVHCTLSYATWQRPTTFQVWKTRGCFCTFRLLMMGDVSPETCWASFKIRNNKILIHCCILLGFSVRIGGIFFGLKMS
jgi:hypothetical protein